MKVVCIVGSPKKNGNTAFLIDKILEGLSGPNIKVKNYVLGRMDINYCLGCKECYKTRKCVQEDDDEVKLIIQDLYESDLVIVGSPVNVKYFLTVFDK